MMGSAGAPLVSADAELATREPPQGGLNLEWRNIECFVAEEVKDQGRLSKLARKALGMDAPLGKPTKKVTKGAFGFARSGEVLAIMGPSGSGKTTLLNVLAQRPTLGATGYWKGEILLNGQKPWRDWERDMAYVMQKDIFYDELKVWENLKTTALLRLPQSWTRKQKLQHLEELLADLGLGKVKDTKIGTATDRGLSGGEVKRANIANERLALPRLFLLDEPLTGLDSARAVDVMQSLQRMARESGTTVILTIHQPSSPLYECFDRLLLLGPGGRTAFFGAIADALEHFKSIGRPVPPYWTPTDHYIELLASEDTCSEICEQWEKLEQPVPPEPTPRPPSHSPMPSVCYQVRVLYPRYFTRIQRTYLNQSAVKLTVGIALAFGLVYFGVARNMPDKLTDYVGTIFFICAHWSWNPLFSGLNNFPRDKEMLIKETTSKAYNILSYVLAQVLAESPLLLVMPVLFFLIVWPMAGLYWSFFVQMFLLIALNIQVCASLSMLISAICLDEDNAIPAAIVTMVLEMCTGGYFADMRKMPWWASWLRYVSIYYYTQGAAARLALMPYGEDIHQQAIARYSFSDMGYATEVAVLALQGVIFRILAYFVLRFSRRLRFT